jgi:hypothetical protein
MQAGYEFSRPVAVEIGGDDQMLLCPLCKFSDDGSLPLQCLIGITSGAKVLEEGFDLILKQVP